MATTTPKMAAARSFVRSLNILLKFVRLYGFEHSRSAEQFRTAWSELRAAIPLGDQTGLLLGAAGNQLVLDGAPIEGAHAERSFAQMLSLAGLASIQFLPKATEDEFARFVRAFPAGNSKPSVLAEQLKAALADTPGIRMNEVRFVAEDASSPEKSLAATLAAKTLTREGGQFSHWLNDPQKLLQLITAAEGSRGGSLGAGIGGESQSGESAGSYYAGWGLGEGDGSGSGGSGTGTGWGSGGGNGSGSGPGDGSGSGLGSGAGGWHEAGTGSGPGPGTGTQSFYSGGLGIGGSDSAGDGTGGWGSGGAGLGSAGSGTGGWGSGSGTDPGSGSGTIGTGTGVGSGLGMGPGQGGGSGMGSGASGPGAGSVGGPGGTGSSAGGWHEAGIGSGSGPGSGTATTFSGGMGIGGAGNSGKGTGGWSSGSGVGAGTGGGQGPGAGPQVGVGGGSGSGSAGLGTGGIGTATGNTGSGSGIGTAGSHPGSGIGSGPGSGSGGGSGIGGWHEAGTGSGPGPGTGTAATFSGGMGIGGTGTSGKGTGGWSSGSSDAGSAAGPSTGAGLGAGWGPGLGTGLGDGAGPGFGPGLGAGLGPGMGPGFGPGRGPGLGPGMGPGWGAGPGRGAGQELGDTGKRSPSGTAGFPTRDPRDEEILMVLRLLSRIGKSAGAEGGLGFGPGSPIQQEVEKLPQRPRDMLRAALVNLGAQVPAVKSNDPMLIRLAEHLAIRFALDRYERGEVRVNAVRQMLDRMSQEITTLRDLAGSQEVKMASAGLVVESHLDVLDRQFWASVPDSGKRAVLTSPDSWCIPPRNLRQFVEELRRKNDEATATQILENYGSAIQNADATARRRVSIGLSEIADLYAVSEPLLGGIIRRTGVQLSLEREDDLQGLISAAFVRLTQEAGSKKFHAALLQALDSLESMEHQRPAFAQSVRPRLGIEKRIPEFVDEALKSSSPSDSLLDLLKRLSGAVSEHIVTRFNRTQFKADCERIAELAGPLQLALTSRYRET